jgi:lipopolysaccharide biosynthesis protein
VRVLAYYFPQFYPIPENDAWWGKGFTDWRYVASAKSLFAGHYQPRIPADLGYYDLRVPETRQAQADLARSCGIEGFLYWHYWFHGRRILNRVFDEVLASGEPRFPFALAWANENWEGSWYGLSHGKRLITQEYSEEDSRNHFYALLPAFRDPRYVKVADKPLFHIKNCYYPPVLNLDHLALWRELAVREGFPGMYFTTEVYSARDWRSPWGRRRLAAFDRWTHINLHDYPEELVVSQAPRTFRYADVARRMVADVPDAGYLPSVLPGWDNTPRWPTGYVFHDADPACFADALRRAVAVAMRRPEEERLVFIKSWNEWSEGNYMEPDMRFGHAFLDAAASCW